MAEKFTQWLRALVLTVDLGLLPRAHLAAHNFLVL